MGQAVASNAAIGTKDTELIRHNVTDVLADALAEAIAKRIFASVLEAE